MSVHITTPAFKGNVREALDDAPLQKALAKVGPGFIGRRAVAAAALPEFEALRDSARDIKNHTLAHLDLYLERFEEKVRAAGGHVHYAVDAAQARDIVTAICKRLDAKTVTKGKSMISEEIALNDHLAANGIEPVETDLGEYLIQIRGEAPSHIIAPAIHLNKEQVEEDFRRVHSHLPPERDLSEPTTLLAEARGELRQRFLMADVGITGANFLVAETGTSIIVTNEGNGDLTQTLPKAHIVLASLEKLVPTLEDVSQILRVLARSATGQDMSVYTTFSTGPRRPEDPDGPGEYHVVILDNGRSGMLAGQLKEMLRCIRCGACMNHCVVFRQIGGHAYGGTYPGPMGAVLTPALDGLAASRELPNACTLNGKCQEVCPVKIPLPTLLRGWREKSWREGLEPTAMRAGIGLWAWVARRPALYRVGTGMAQRALRLWGRNGWIRSLPLAGGWTRHRDMPVPKGGTFMTQWKKKNRR